MPFDPCWCRGERSSSPPQTTFMIYFPTECVDPPMFIYIFSLQSITMGSFMWTWLRLTFHIYKTDLGHKWLKVRQKWNVSFEKYVCLQMLLDIVLACAITFWVSVYKYFEFWGHSCSALYEACKTGNVHHVQHHKNKSIRIISTVHNAHSKKQHPLECYDIQSPRTP